MNPILPKLVVTLVFLFLFLVILMSLNMWKMQELLQFSWEMRDTHPEIHQKLDNVQQDLSTCLAARKD